MKQVREISNCSAWIVLDKKGREVANIQARYGSGGGVQVDVWATKPGEKCLALVHQKKSSGYGYDKFTASLAGAEIDGYRMADHCGRAEEKHEKQKAALLRAYRRRVLSAPMTKDETTKFEQKAARIGARFANYCKDTRADGSEYWSWQSLHTQSGLDRLDCMGYRVIRAL